MFKNYFITAYRNTIRNKVTTIINVLGLGLGIGVFLLIFLYVNQELGVDRFIKDKNRIFRLEWGEWAIMGPGFSSKILEICPEVEDAIVIQSYFLHNEPLKIDNTPIAVCNYLPVSPSFISFFGFKVLNGDANNPLTDKNSIVLTKSEAKRLFGKDNPIGKTITIYDELHLTVTAIIEDSRNFHLSFNALLSFEIMPPLYGWTNLESMLIGNMNNPTYLKLSSLEQKEQVEDRINSYMRERYGSRIHEGFSLRAISDIYFKGALKFEGKVNHGNMKFILVMVSVAILILFLACVNYINLSTARASTRSKEIGVRKVVGGSRFSIINQFLGESIIIVFLSLLIGIAIVELFTPLFSTLVERDLSSSTLFSFHTIATLIIGSVLLGLLSGFYPALYLSSFAPTQVLKGIIAKGAKGGSFRKALIIFQFSVSVGLIISTIIIFSQLNYFTNFDLGFNKDQIVNVAIPRKVAFSYDVFKEKILKIPAVMGVSRSNSKMGQIGWQESFKDNNGDTHNYSYHIVDPDYINLLDIKLKDGRDFDWDRPSDLKETIIINETMARMLGNENPIGTILKGGYGNLEIIGIIKDFNFNSLHSGIGPLGLSYRGSSYNTFNIKVDTDRLNEVLHQLQSVWDEYSVETPFEYSFLNESFAQSYRSEERMGKMFGYFAVIAIFIGCMGLYGLSAFMLQARVKEMGIRKVMGASTLRIMGIMGYEFAILVLISNAVAWPISFYAMSKWLQGFPYQTNLSILYFIIAMVISLLIAFLTVSYHSWKTARTNPVESLKYE